MAKNGLKQAGVHRCVFRFGRSTTRCGFCVPELLLLLGLLCIAFSVGYFVVASIRQQDREARVRVDFDRFIEASHRFYAEYDMWPSLYLNVEGDTRYGTTQHPNREVIQALTGVSGPGNPMHRLNPARIVFLDLPPYNPARGLSGLDANGDFLDPWGRPYQIVLDTDLDGRAVIDRSAWGAIEGEGVVIWSVGPDGISGTPDDIVSWE